MPDLSEILRTLLAPEPGSDLPGGAPADPIPSLSLPSAGALPQAPGGSMTPPMPPGMPQGQPQSHGTGDLIRDLAPLLIAAVTGARHPLHGAAIASGAYQGMHAAMQEGLAQQERDQQKRVLASRFMQQTAADVMRLKDPIERQQYLQYAHDIGVQEFGMASGWTKSIPSHDPSADTFGALKGELAQKLAAFDKDKRWADVAGTPGEAKISFSLSNGQRVPVNMARQLVGQAVFDTSGAQAYAPKDPSGKTEQERAANLLAGIRTAKARGDTAKADELQAAYDDLMQAKHDLTVPKSLQQTEVLVHGKRVLANFDPASGKLFDAKGVEIVDAQPAPSKAAAGGSSVATVPDIKPNTPAFKTAQDLAYGRLTFAQFRTIMAYNRDASAKMAIYAKAADLNPEFNPAKFEMGFRFAANPQTQRALAAVDNVLPNIDWIVALSDSWDRTKYPDVNRLLSAMQFKVGNRTVSNLRQAQKLIGDELGVALGAGGMTDMKLQLGLDVVDPTLAPDVFLSNMERVKEFLMKRKASLLHQMGPYGTSEMNPGADLPKTTPSAAPIKIGRFQVQIGGGA
jgi:hypothetical protein